MASKTEMCNLAISHLGSGKVIANIETEKSAEAAVCRTFFDTTTEKVLRDYPWPFATKFLALGLVAENPTTEWAYSYRYPADCLFFRRILSGVRNDTRQSRVPFRRAMDDAGQLIYTDEQDAVGEWTVRVNNTERFAPDFVLAHSFLLASLIAPRLTGGDQLKLGPKLLQLYMLELDNAKTNSANEEQVEEEPQSEFIRARE